jgi:hypothetical protein
MDFSLYLARVDIAPPKPNQQWKGFAKTPTKTLSQEHFKQEIKSS